MIGQRSAKIYQGAGATDVVGPQVVHFAQKEMFVRLGLFIFRLGARGSAAQGFPTQPPPKTPKAAIFV